MAKVIWSIDVEKDLHSDTYESVKLGLKNFEVVCDKNNIKPVLFVTADCIKKYPGIFKRFHKKGWEISSHGFTHKRFDEMSYSEKEAEIKNSINYFKKYIGVKPKGFRAPQHSIDWETLDLLEQYGFKYDSSYTPLNLIQLFFFPKKFLLWINSFFSKLSPYKIKDDLMEIPTSALIIPFVSLTVRIFPKIFLRVFLSLIKLVYKQPIFYAHSWDFIELKQSKIDRKFPHYNFLRKLDYLMSLEK